MKYQNYLYITLPWSNKVQYVLFEYRDTLNYNERLLSVDDRIPCLLRSASCLDNVLLLKDSLATSIPVTMVYLIPLRKT